jgi:hypothetical protein
MPYHRISRSRQVIIDLMYFSMSFPLITIERSMNFGELASARRDHPQRPSWSAVFAKGFALAAEEFAVLRQGYFRFPIPYIYEYEDTTVNIAHELSVGGEASVLPVRVRSPNKMSLDDIRSKIVEMADADLWQRGFYQTLSAISFLPSFLRRPIWWGVINVPRFRRRGFGTAVITSIGALGAELLTPRAPVTSLLAYGPLDRNGSLRVRLVFDHRVYDGATAARVLARLEELMLGPILAEIKPQSSDNCSSRVN